MPDLFDALRQRLGDEEPGGITPLDLTELPPEQKAVMLTLLRDQAGSVQGVTGSDLRARVAARVVDFDGVLAELERLGWLIVSGEAPNLYYRVNFRARRANQGGVLSLWAVLSDHISKDA